MLGPDYNSNPGRIAIGRRRVGTLGPLASALCPLTVNLSVSLSHVLFPCYQKKRAEADPSPSSTMKETMTEAIGSIMHHFASPQEGPVSVSTREGTSRVTAVAMI